MSKFLRVPEAAEFSKLVNLYESTYSKLDSIYMKALQDIETKQLRRFSRIDTESILYPYLLKWGNMKRVLGYRGCKKIGEKLKEMDSKIAKLREVHLSTVDLEGRENEFALIYDDIMNANWKSEKGRSKRVGPTAASKVLHLVAPNLFMIWDRAIRKYYGFKEDKTEYVQFLKDMKYWMDKLGKRIVTLQIRYGKSSTKIVDEYNWIKSNWKPEFGKKTKDRQLANGFKGKKSMERTHGKDSIENLVEGIVNEINKQGIGAFEVNETSGYFSIAVAGRARNKNVACFANNEYVISIHRNANVEKSFLETAPYSKLKRRSIPPPILQLRDWSLYPHNLEYDVKEDKDVIFQICRKACENFLR